MARQDGTTARVSLNDLDRATFWLWHILEAGNIVATQDVPHVQNVLDALNALENDTDAIVTDKSARVTVEG